MENPGILMLLALLTLLAGLGWGAYQLWSVEDAKKKGSHVDGSKERPTA